MFIPSERKCRISDKNTKMGEIPSFSLMPVRTCVGAVKGKCPCAVDGYCYILQNLKPSERENYEDNTALAENDLDELERELMEYFGYVNAPRLFRIHVAGDFFSVTYARMWYRIIKANPGTYFFGFTKSFDIVREVPFYELSNYNLVLSEWDDIYLAPEDLKQHYKVSKATSLYNADLSGNTFMCKGNCESCVVCATKELMPDKVQFIFHGKRFCYPIEDEYLTDRRIREFSDCVTIKTRSRTYVGLARLILKHLTEINSLININHVTDYADKHIILEKAYKAVHAGNIIVCKDGVAIKAI